MHYYARRVLGLSYLCTCCFGEVVSCVCPSDRPVVEVVSSKKTEDCDWVRNLLLMKDWLQNHWLIGSFWDMRFISGSNSDPFCTWWSSCFHARKAYTPHRHTPIYSHTHKHTTHITRYRHKHTLNPTHTQRRPRDDWFITDSFSWAAVRIQGQFL